MVDKKPKQLPHLIVNNTATTNSYTSPGSGGGNGLELPIRDRQKHADKLISQLEKLQGNEKIIVEEQKAFGIEYHGIQIEFESDPDFTLKLESLEFQRSGIELCSSHIDSDNKVKAVVFIPEGKLDYFLKKVIAYKDEDTPPNQKGLTKPKNQLLIDSIAKIKLAVLESLWTDDLQLLPQDNKPMWWEVWVLLSDQSDPLAFFQEHAERLGFRVSENKIHFVDRAVILVFGTRESMIKSATLLGTIAELRQAKEVAGFFTQMDAVEQSKWIEESRERIQLAPNIKTYACLLDSGVNEGHPLLQPVAQTSDMHTYNPAWGTHDGHQNGHGTPMAGLALYGDLTTQFASNHPIAISHQLESVKILPNSGTGQNDPKLYGFITRESIARVEVEHPERQRVFCMAVTTTDNRDRGKPSSWSATVDAIASGADDEAQRLIILSAGNVDLDHIANYPDSNHTDMVHDPGQAWNALTVGGYTEKIQINDPDLSSYEPLATSGDLSPCSCTSMTWGKNWPFKPDIVMEAGNVGIDHSLNFVSTIDDLQLLSTHHDINQKQLVAFGDTSAATALATRLAAMLQAEYPDFWAETLRGLLVHSAEWTDELKANFNLRTKQGYRQLLHYCGYGVPNEQKLLWSVNNSLTLIVQDSLQPFMKEKSAIKTCDIKLHDIPWPKDVLERLGETQVEMKVTLSYFIEPNPAQRGWSTKYRYASHRLQFDVRRALESMDAFKQRINKQARDDAFKSKNNAKETGEWLLGANLRKTGSIHSDTWSGTAMDLSNRQHIAIYPLSGWWKELKQHERWGNKARYSLIISITTPRTDIYTAVENQIRTEIHI